MAERLIIWTRTADIQFVEILAYWVQRNKSTAYSEKLIRLVSKLTKQIAKTPYLYRASGFNDVRVASLKNFSIYYKVSTLKIIIMAFWDDRQDFKKLLNLLESK